MRYEFLTLGRTSDFSIWCAKNIYLCQKSTGKVKVFALYIYAFEDVSFYHSCVIVNLLVVVLKCSLMKSLEGVYIV